jgi:hypothetical protein
MGETMEYKIQIDKTPIVYPIYVLVLFGGVGGLLLFFFGVQLATLLLWGLGLIAALIMINTDFLRYPSTVRIDNTGVLLIFKFKKSRFVGWNQMGRIFIGEKSGALKVGKEYGFYPLSREVSLIIRDEHKKQTGKDLQMWVGKQRYSLRLSKDT